MRLFLLFSFSALMLHEAYGFTDEPDRKALLDFKSQVSEENQDALSSWNNSSPLCNWKGVTCGLKNKRVTRLNLGGCQLRGMISPSIGNISFLISLNLSDNSIGGTIPYEVGNLFRLKYLNISFNFLEGEIPDNLFNCSRLLDLDLWHNHLGGGLPASLGNLTSLTRVRFSENNLEGRIPDDLARLTQLVHLGLGENKFSGGFPPSIYNFSSLEYLNMFGLMGAKILDFSNNDFSGSIPGYFGNFSLLEYLNLSINNFEGEVPTEGKFRNATVVLVFGNKYLCGGIKELKLNQCIVQAQPSHSSGSKKVTIELSIGIALLLIVLISYAYLRNATDGFSSSNLIGSGSFGTVFKAFLPTENKVVAVKVLNLQRRGAMKSFLTECESLKDIRHRNLVKLLTACSSTDLQGNDFRALIYELMPNGSLDMWLHPEEVEEIRRPSRTLTLFERLNIAVDVISVLEYLHVYCHEPIAHCDLKPSNVLLDKDLTGHVSDFGIARLLMKLDQESFFNHLSSAGVRGTIGYAPPGKTLSHISTV
ncbi:unnamed protein product [Brassica rapa subsp. trilocularis]